MFGPKVQFDAQAHALKEYPDEACGIVVAGQYIPIINISPTPQDSFELPAWTLLFYQVQAVIHSHCGPHHPKEPSPADYANQRQLNLPYGLVWTDGKYALPIVWFGGPYATQDCAPRQAP